MTDYSFMLGASASVLAIVAATAYREPNYPIRLLLFGTIRLKYLALIVIGTDLLFITSSNAGGHIAHLGGALAGVWFAASLSKGSDDLMDKQMSGYLSFHRQLQTQKAENESTLRYWQTKRL